ncbi:2-oxo-4-hydroxy-4-carboxy-5-ureidoimidazoline decarboxylase [Pseudonocardia sp. CA-107938]|uniref:2-oxo-4-hydroxy-4-carboxy-5-ureidoimidazoline decarboxylase n=1 Tax=Pseudonocardia sp. CA-107938 TaxID=3240021 RepID=UPI003D94CF06
MDLPTFNALSDGEARAALEAVCSAPRWAAAVAAQRPFPDVGALQACADAELSATDLDDGLAGHPRIGERVSGRSAREQSGVGDDVRAALVEGNRVYEERFGHVYLVCASGRSGAELLATLQERLGNDPETEREVALSELRKINALRLEGLVT